MQHLKLLISAVVFCFALLPSLGASDIQALLNPAVDKVDYRFFYWLFDQEGLEEAYKLAQQEDFEAGEKTLFTENMQALMVLPMKRWEDKLGNLDAFWNLEGELKSLGAETSTELLQAWRYSFLSRMMEFIRIKSQQKPVFSAMVLSETKFDSNVQRVNDDGTNTPSSGKDDGQQMFLLNFKWKPLINNRKFQRNNDFSQNFNGIAIHQFTHKENQVNIIDTESKYTRKIKTILDSFSIGYRIQNFGLSGDEDSRSTSTRFNSHRLKADWNFKTQTLDMGPFVGTKSDVSLAGTLKLQSDNNDTDEWRLTLAQTFFYESSALNGSLKGAFKYQDSQRDNAPNSDYDYWDLSLRHAHKMNINWLPSALNLSQTLAYRSKEWDSSTSVSEETQTSLQLKASTKIADSFRGYLALKQLWFDREGTSDGSGDQTTLALGLSWSMK